MGICRKCRKKTDLFCWHCTNAVCYDCLVEDQHKLAYIGTYEEWISQPDKPLAVCGLTKKVLAPDDEVIRFMNLQLFLLSAIDNYGKSLPPNTALAGFTIPGTNIPMVPPVEQKSKLAQQIRQKLMQFPWISNLIALQSETTDKSGTAKTEGASSSELMDNFTSDLSSSLTQSSLASRKAQPNNNHHPPVKQPGKPTSSEHPGDIAIDLLTTPYKAGPGTVAGGIPYVPGRQMDRDGGDKYKRRTLGISSLFGASKSEGAVAQRYHITGKRLLLILALVVTLMVVFFLNMKLEQDPTAPLFEGKEDIGGDHGNQFEAKATQLDHGNQLFEAEATQLEHGNQFEAEATQLDHGNQFEAEATQQQQQQ